MNSNLSRNVEKIEISGIRKFYNKVSAYPDAVSLTLGQPDFSVPVKIKNAMIEAIEDNKTGYTSNAGIIELREAIGNYLKGYNINFNSDEICITVGGSEALSCVFTAVINSKDKVLVPSPAYPAYESCIKMVGGEVINYKLRKDFSVDFEYLQRIIEKEKPKCMVLSYPCNPTGAVLSRDECEKLHNIIKKNQIIVITDEIYSALCYEDEYCSVAQYDDIKDNIILVSGFSKMFSMTGLRVGYVCAKQKYMNAIMKVHQYNVSCAPSIAQWGALEGLKSCRDEVEKMKMEFLERRDYVYKRLLMLGFEANLPKGAFYIFPSIKNFNMKSEEFCNRLLDEAKVAIVPGNAFGCKGEGHVRISYSYSMNILENSMDAIEKWVKNNF